MNENGIVISSLHHKTHIAELWHGRSGNAEDFTGSEIPDGYIALIRAVYAELVWEELHPAGELLNFAVPTSLWVSACLQAREAGVPVNYIICPFASMPWKDAHLICVGVTQAQAENYMRKIRRDADYILHPRAAAAYCALQTHRVMLGEATPAVLLATESPMQAQAQIREVLGLTGELSAEISASRKRFEVY